MQYRNQVRANLVTLHPKKKMNLKKLILKKLNLKSQKDLM